MRCGPKGNGSVRVASELAFDRSNPKCARFWISTRQSCFYDVDYFYDAGQVKAASHCARLGATFFRFHGYVFDILAAASASDQSHSRPTIYFDRTCGMRVFAFNLGTPLARQIAQRHRSSASTYNPGAVRNPKTSSLFNRRNRRNRTYPQSFFTGGSPAWGHSMGISIAPDDKRGARIAFNFSRIR